MKFSRVRQYLKLATDVCEPDAAMSKALNDFFTVLARIDDLDSEEVTKMFAAMKLPKAAKPHENDSPTGLETLAVAELRALFDDDYAFRDALERLKANRAITRGGLNRIFCQLFDKQRSLASKATREKLVQDIGDLRLTRVRSKRAAEYFSGKVA